MGVIGVLDDLRQTLKPIGRQGLGARAGSLKGSSEDSRRRREETGQLPDGAPGFGLHPRREVAGRRRVMEEKPGSLLWRAVPVRSGRWGRIP
jgi:hypothetical protein